MAHHLERVKHSANEECPPEYEYANLGYWEGVNSGCLCDDGTVHKRAYCTVSGSRCKFVKNIRSIPYTKWKTNKVCVKRYLFQLVKS